MKQALLISIWVTVIATILCWVSFYGMEYYRDSAPRVCDSGECVPDIASSSWKISEVMETMLYVIPLVAVLIMAGWAAGRNRQRGSQVMTYLQPLPLFAVLVASEAVWYQPWAYILTESGIYVSRYTHDAVFPMYGLAVVALYYTALLILHVARRIAELLTNHNNSRNHDNQSAN